MAGVKKTKAFNLHFKSFRFSSSLASRVEIYCTPQTTCRKIKLFLHPNQQKHWQIFLLFVQMSTLSFFTFRFVCRMKIDILSRRWKTQGYELFHKSRRSSNRLAFPFAAQTMDKQFNTWWDMNQHKNCPIKLKKHFNKFEFRVWVINIL